MTIDPDKRDYKDTVFLPRTDFPMRGGLSTKEPQILEQWQAQDLYGQLRRAAASQPKFVLHDGPPYANGSIHIGHATNKILKDVVTRTRQMQGYDAPYVPGWDCHGLPIEWKIEERYREAGKNKDDVPILEFRRECREFAASWVKTQTAEFQRLGVLGDWDNPYTTMTFAAEARIIGEIHKFLMNGGLYQGVKPVLWSVVEKTALAEAEVEYHDHKSIMIWVRFPIINGKWKDASIVIWTTTPWTIPANRAVACGPEIEYGLYETPAGERLVLAIALAAATFEKAGIAGARLLETAMGSELVQGGTVCAHPLRHHGFPMALEGHDPIIVPLLEGDFVTADAGTGFVHIAPSHGEDDFNLGKIHNLGIPRTIDDEGRYYPQVPLFAGKRVYLPDGKTGDANGAVITALIEAGMLLAKGSLTHSYPHSWRSKAPLIFRTTPQWFISMETNDLRQRALAAIESTRWIPAQGRKRIASMVENRPDWCISRQRAWGVPLAFFVHRNTGEPLKDPAVLSRIVRAFQEEGADSWYARPSEDFLGTGYEAADYHKVMDIVDVWFESGCTHAFVLEDRPALKWPADLYLEGSDQHRGWFHSSLLESCGTRGRAPYDAVLTHGFALDEKGRKMSKSLGNVIAPQTVCDREGADILRLWVVGSNYAEDVLIGPDILKQQGDLYRRLRNTLRYLLGALDDYTSTEAVGYEAMEPLEQWMLHRLHAVDQVRRDAIESYDFTALVGALHHFAATELSAFYFDVCKDSLYCDRIDSLRRRAVRTVMNHLFECLVLWLAPVLCFTAEEAWAARGNEGSVHLQGFPVLPEMWKNDALDADWQTLRRIRGLVTGAIELAREAKTVGASLEAAPILHVDSAADYDWLTSRNFPLAMFTITSHLELTEGAAPTEAFTQPDLPGFAVTIAIAKGEKCERCWRILPEVGKQPGHEQLCGRCADAVDAPVRNAA